VWLLLTQWSSKRTQFAWFRQLLRTAGEIMLDANMQATEPLVEQQNDASDFGHLADCHMQ
jgi:hypothetical protein